MGKESQRAATGYLKELEDSWGMIEQGTTIGLTPAGEEYEISDTAREKLTGEETQTGEGDDFGFDFD